MTIEEASAALIAHHGWSEESAAVWLNAKGYCEYCGLDLLEFPDVHFFGSQIDHIIPAGGQSTHNLALSCKACNFIKRNRVFAEAGSKLSRDELISRAPVYIKAERELKRQRLAKSIALLTLCGIERRGPGI